MKLIYFLLLVFITNSSMAQNVGIGVTNPLRGKLEVETTNTTAAIFASPRDTQTPGTGISIQNYWPTIGFNQYRDQSGQFSYIGDGYAGVQYLDPHNGGLYFDFYTYGGANLPVPSAKRVFSIQQSGNVTVGTAYYNSALTVSKSFGNDAVACFTGSGYSSFFNYGPDESTHIRAGLGGSTVYISDISGGKTSISGVMGINNVNGGTTSIMGSVGINTGDPSFPLEIRQPAGDKGLCIVNPNTWHNWEFRVSGGAGWMHLFYDGLLRGRFYENGDYGAASDRRIKTNIHALPSLLGKVLQLEPVEYEFKDKNPNHKKSIGFIAQDVKKLFPELVNVTQDTATGYKGINDLHTVNYSGFGTIAVKAIQEQQQIIQSLQDQIGELQKKVNMLVKASNSLTNK